MPSLSQAHDQVRTAESHLSLLQAYDRSLSPSTPWESPSGATLRYLVRQKHRAETQLNLDAAIVQDHRGWLAFAVLFAGLAYFTRSAGLPLVLAILAWLALDGRCSGDSLKHCSSSDCSPTGAPGHS